jgi:hypothetical protein
MNVFSYFDFYRLPPPYWIQNAQTSREWDGHLNDLLNSYPVEIVTSHVAKVGGVHVWISNFPYAYGSPYRPIEFDVLPCVKTRKRLRSLVFAALIRGGRA